MTVDYRTVCLWLLANCPVVIIGLIFVGIATVMLHARCFQVVRRRAVIPMDDEPFMDDGPEPKQVAALFAKSAGNVPDAKPEGVLRLEVPKAIGPYGVHPDDCRLAAFNEWCGVSIRVGDLRALLRIAPKDPATRHVSTESPLATVADVRRIVAEELAKHTIAKHSELKRRVIKCDRCGWEPANGEALMGTLDGSGRVQCRGCKESGHGLHWFKPTTESTPAEPPATDVVKLLEIDAPALTVTRNEDGNYTIQVQGPRNRCFDLLEYNIFEMPNGRTIHAQQQRRNPEDWYTDHKG